MSDKTYRILHLTDFHFDPKKASDQKVIVNELKLDLTKITKDKKIDLIIFSGDLVGRGSDAGSFHGAKTLLLDSLRDLSGLTDRDILICPGNHDVDISALARDPYIEPGLKAQLHSRENLNSHIDNYFEEPLPRDQANVRLTNYFDFLRRSYHQDALFSSNYVDCFVRPSNVGNIGLASFNSAWRSTGAGETERNLLLLSERVVERAAGFIKECPLKIAIVHHPLDWLAFWDAKAVRIPLFVNFDLVLFGHVHENMPSLVQNTIGECLLAQGGCLYQSREYYNGYQLIDISTNGGFQFVFHMRSWFDHPRRSFGAAENICDHGVKTFRLHPEAAGSNKLSVQELFEMENALNDAANAHLQTLQLGGTIAFEDSFTCPPLSQKTESELVRLTPDDYKEKLIELDSLIEFGGTRVVSGARESGKTTIALKIAKDCLKRGATGFRLPILVNFASLRTYDDLERLVRRHIASLELDLRAKRLLANHKCLFVVDNVSLDEHAKISRLQKLMKSSGAQHDWIIFLDSAELLSRETINSEFGATESPVFIHPFRRGEIRALVTKIASTPVKGPGDVDTIIKLMSDNDLPRNPYIVTLLTSVLTEISVDSQINEAALLDKMIDLLLNKEDPSHLLRSSTDFAGLNILLEQIAFWLSATGGSLQENELLGRLALFLKERGIIEGAGTLLQRFIEAGIVERTADEISFRYRSFQSFFLARYAARNKDFAPQLLENLAISKYRKEFSLLCDLSRKDADLLGYLEVIILELHPRIFTTIDKAAFLKGTLGVTFKAIIDGKLDDISGGPQSTTKLDEMHDFQDRATASLAAQLREVHPKISSQGTDEEEQHKLDILMRAGAYLEAWRAWGRAITSLDFVELSIRKPSFIKLLDHWSRLVALITVAATKFLTDVADEVAKAGKPLTEKNKAQLEYIGRVNMPLSAAQAIFSHIGSSSIHQLLIETFDEINLQSPEALGAACMLIRQRPDGWISRVGQYIEKRDAKGVQSAAQYFILEALYQEYYFRHLSKAETTAIEGLIAQLLSHAGFVHGKKDAIQQNIEKHRPRVDLLTRKIKT